MLKTTGIHHVSSIVGHAQSNVDFYAGVLGLRLLKQTLNFGDKERLHLFFGNTDGSTGIVTTFPMEEDVDGRIGDGQVAVVSYALNPKSFVFWKERFAAFNLQYSEHVRFGLKRLKFKDLDGLEMEFIETDQFDDRAWSFDSISSEDAFQGIHSALLYSKEPQATLKLLTDMFNYKIVNENQKYYQLQVSDSMGGMIELSKTSQGHGQISIGTVHHLALSVENSEIEQWRIKLLNKGYQVTEVKDRSYFKSLYFREKGGILIELATQGPGLLLDEDLNNLGKNFQIPKHFGDDKEEILNRISPLEVRKIKELKK